MLLDKPLSPQRLRLDISTITIIKNTQRGGRLEEGKGGSLGLALSLSPSHRLPRAFFFPSPQPSYDTKRPLQRRQDGPARQTAAP